MRILGVDLGSSRVKAVEVENAFRRTEVLEYYEEPIELGENATQALGRLMSRLPRKPDRVVTSLDTQQVTFRSMNLPTRDRKAILAAVHFELEDDLPFNLEDCITSYRILNQSKQSSLVHVELTLKKYVESHLELLSSAQVDPDLVTSRAWALKKICDRSIKTEDKQQPFLVIDIGSSHTCLYIQTSEEPVMIKDLSWGGNDLTEALSRKYNVPTDQAEKAKIDSGFVLSKAFQAQATAEQIEFSDILLEALSPFFTEIRKANLASKNATGQRIARIYLTGGGGLLPGLRQSLEDEFKLPTVLLQGLSQVHPPGGVTYSEQTEAHFSFAAGLALSGLDQEKGTWLNFRKGEFQRSRGTSQIEIQQLKGPLISIATISTCLLISLSLQSGIYRSKIEDLDTQLKRTVKLLFPLVSVKALANYLVKPEELQKDVNNELTKQREIASLFSGNAQSPIQFLKNISTKIPSRVVVDLVHFEIGAAPEKKDQMNLVFLFKSKDDIDAVESRLKEVIESLQKGEVTATTLPGTQESRWQVSFSGVPKEAAYER